MSAKLITYLNILRPIERIEQELPITIKNSDDLKEFLQVDENIYEIVYSRNNFIIEEPFFYIEDEDKINVVVVPKGGNGKNILRVVAMVALTVAAPYAAAGVIGGGMTAATLSLGGSLLAGGIIAAGSMLINAVLPAPTPDISSFETNSQQYSWDTASNIVNQGAALPKLFGKTKITPPLISRYVESNGDKQYLHALFALNDGEISTVENIKINDNDIDNYDGVYSEIRYGTNNQTPISNFEQTRFDQTLNNKIDRLADWDYFTTIGDNITGIKIVFNLPVGLFGLDPQGDYETCYWDIYIDYSDDGINWITSTNPVTISGKSVKPRFYTHDITGLTENQYEIRVKAVFRRGDDLVFTTGSEDSRYPSTLYVSYIQELTDEEFSYPNTALLAIRALATDQLSGSFPNITAVVDSGVSNPSDICISILEEVGIEEDLIDTTKFDEWRTFCEDNEYYFNGYIDNTTNVRKVLDLVSTVGRARVEQFGSRYSVVVDKPNETPVQNFMFGMGNIIRDSFKEQFLPLADRANVIEITFSDEDNDYQRTSIEVSGEGYDSESEENRTAVDLIGCVNREMAIRHAKYLLNTNRYVSLTCNFESDVDALVCRYGDIISVSHDVPNWGISGRIISANSTAVVLDREYEMSDGATNYIKLKSSSNNNVYDYELVYSETPSDTVYFAESVEEDFVENDVYSCGVVNNISKLFRVVGISTTGNELKRRITAVEYDDRVFDDSGYIEPTSNVLFGINNIYVKEYTEYINGGYQSNIDIKWSGAGLYYTVTYKTPNTVRSASFKVFDSSATIGNAEYGEYAITITDNFGSSKTITYNVEDIVSRALPDITNLVQCYNNFAGGITILSWDAVKNDVRENNIDYEIRLGESWDTGIYVTRVKDNKYTVANNGKYWIACHFVFNEQHIYSNNPQSITVTTGQISQNVVKEYNAFDDEWGGTISTGLEIDEYNHLVFTNPSVVSSGYYTMPEANIVDVGRVTPCNLIISYSVYGFNTDTDILTMADVLSVGDLLGTLLGKYVSITPQISTAGDDEVFSEWQSYIPGYYNARYFKARLLIQTLDVSVNLALTDFSFVVDVPDRIETKALTTNNSDFVSVTYPSPFNGSEESDNIPRVHATIVSQQNGDYVVLQNETKSGFEIAVKNGSDFVIRNVNTITKGY